MTGKRPLRVESGPSASPELLHQAITSILNQIQHPLKFLRAAVVGIGNLVAVDEAQTVIGEPPHLSTVK